MRKLDRDAWMSALIDGYHEAMAEYGISRVEEVLSAVGPGQWHDTLCDASAARLRPIPSSPARLRKALARLPEARAILTLAINAARLRCAVAEEAATKFLHGPLCPGRETQDAFERAMQATRLMEQRRQIYALRPFDENGNFSWNDWENSKHEQLS